MAKKLTVVTDVGTFTRRTDRTYTHLVVAGRYTDAFIAQHRASDHESARQNLAYHERQLAGTEKVYNWETTADIAATMKKIEEELASGIDARWDTHAADATFGVLGWSGRLDLAVKLAHSTQASYYTDVRIYDVATGKRVK